LDGTINAEKRKIWDFWIGVSLCKQYWFHDSPNNCNHHYMCAKLVRGLLYTNNSC
jgi:hypothetical protein